MPSLPSQALPLARAAQTLARGLAGLAYPALCLGCEGRVDPAEALCPSCLRGLPRADAETPSALLAESPVNRAVALWAYDPGGTVRRIHHALKYGARPSLGVQLGRVLGAAAREAGVAPDIVVPVPLSRVRRLERGYNQAEVLARGVGEALDVPVVGLVVRTRPTRAQAALSKAERRRNVAGAFALAPGAGVAGAHVLLVDDVLTTGATIAATAAPLAEAGATVEAAVLGLAGT